MKTVVITVPMMPLKAVDPIKYPVDGNPAIEYDRPVRCPVNGVLAKTMKKDEKVTVIYINTIGDNSFCREMEKVFKEELQEINKEIGADLDFKTVEMEFAATMQAHNKLILDLAELIPEKAEIFADITYGFKTEILSLVCALRFVEEYRDANLQYFIYAKLEKKKGTKEKENAMLYDGLEDLADYIRSKGSEVSIITNGYSLSDQKVDALSECGVSMIGLSIDSPNAATLRKMGRTTVSGGILDPERCVSICRHINKKNITLKINTVISRQNHTEDFSSFIQAAQPSRWKLLKIKKFKNKNFDNSSLLISDAQFDNFILRHRAIPHIAEWTMHNAYIMVDAFGNLVDTGSSDNTPIADLGKTNFADAFSRMEFDYETYHARYAA